MKKVILFDGVCNLCDSSVTFVIKRDKKNVFKFATLQSEVGKKLAKQHSIDLSKVDSIILVTDKKAYVKSTAALFIAQKLSGLWPLMIIFYIIPTFIRNWVYDFIASNRYKWYGKKDACMIPTPELKSKFLEDSI